MSFEFFLNFQKARQMTSTLSNSWAIFVRIQPFPPLIQQVYTLPSSITQPRLSTPVKRMKFCVSVAVHKVFNTSRIVNSEDFIFDSTDICQHIHIHIRLIAGPKSPVSVVLSRSIEITYIYATTRPKLNFVMAPHEYLYLYL